MSNPPAVVNVLTKLTRLFPDKSITPGVAATVTVLEAGSTPAFNVTTRLSADTLMPIPNLFPSTNKPTVLLLIVLGFSGLLKVNTTAAFSPIPVAPLPGVTIATTGAVVSVPPPVVNELSKKLLLFPDKSTTPPFTSTRIWLFAGSGDSGVNVTTLPLGSTA